MYDFLRFEIFIAPSVLLFCYYLGAVGIPLAAVLLVRKLFATYPALGGAAKTAGAQIKASASRKNRLRIYLAMAAVFVCMEIVWRMMFEAMIAYFQMREALMGMAGS
ncbi:MAG: hypothetical protein COB39_11905 [Marinosulfonomonas sp.]|nr:MAG: hypothetical protein COB39_11905 [Marinosulfonomonas sp.]